MSVTDWGGVTLTLELGLAVPSTTVPLWDVGLWDVALWGPDVTWTDVTGYMRRVSTSRAFSRAAQSWRTGTAEITLDNIDGRFSAANLTGPYVASGRTQIQPGVPVRLTAEYGGVTYPVWRGYVTRWTETWSGGAPGEGDATTDLSCVDEWSRLERVPGVEVPAAGAGELFGARVHRILDMAGSTAARDIDPGATTMQATTHAQGAVAELDDTARAEGGAVWVDADGTIVAEGRAALIENDRSVTSQATWTDDGTDLSYATAQVAHDDDLVVNYAAYTREGGAMQEVSASASRYRHGWRPDVRTGLICETDAQALQLAQWQITQYQDPEYRFAAITVRPGYDPAALWPQVLGRRMRDMVTVVRNPPGGYEISRACHITGVAHTITPDDWTCVLALQSATVYAAYATSRWDIGLWDEALWSF